MMKPRGQSLSPDTLPHSESNVPNVSLRMVKIITSTHGRVYTAHYIKNRVPIYSLEFFFTGSRFYISIPAQTSHTQPFTIHVSNHTLSTYDRRHLFTPFRWIKLKKADKLAVYYGNTTAVVPMCLTFDCFWGGQLRCRDPEEK